MARGLLREDIEGPRPFHPKSGVFGWLSSALGHVEGWRGLAYLLAKVPVSLAALAAMWATWATGLMFLAYPVWRSAVDPVNTDSQGRTHHSGINFGDNYMDTWSEVVAVAAAGLVLLLIAPWLVRVFVRLDVWLMRALLGPTKTSERVRDLEETRAIAVDDSAARLRRIERDLHDGAQARIVALAMHLSQAQEQLDRDAAAADNRAVDVDKARSHVDTALGNARLAITELRDLARGIHPPVLDQGLGPALATLAAGSAVPVRLDTRTDPRPPAAIESIAYFCAAELLANATRHAGATEIAVEAVNDGGTLTVRVRDNGSGGAHAREGGGLAGLAERVRTVDGRLDIDSPPGGPTTVTARLPIRH
jgi:signal transduction histidine kinase